MRISFNGDTTVALLTKPFDCLKLQGIRDNGPLAAMGLRLGDLLVAVDAQDWNVVAELRAQASASYKQESTTWTISRGGALVDVQLNGWQVAQAISSTSENRDTLYFTNAMRE
jgi:membrane-associated protease RseP (regulator of RpoE activity)